MAIHNPVDVNFTWKGREWLAEVEYTNSEDGGIKIAKVELYPADDEDDFDNFPEVLTEEEHRQICVDPILLERLEDYFSAQAEAWAERGGN